MHIISKKIEENNSQEDEFTIGIYSYHARNLILKSEYVITKNGDFFSEGHSTFSPKKLYDLLEKDKVFLREEKGIDVWVFRSHAN